jgi:two-component system OmpR family response regulator
MKILLIEDDTDISSFIKTNLEEDGLLVDISKDGADGSFMARTNHYDVIIIDHSLPIKDGLTICEEIRSSHIETPIIFLTVYTDVRRKVSALEKGADDYMTKPFALEELKARLFALKRRPHKIESTVLRVDDLILDTYKRTVRRGDIQIYLTRKTYDLLEHLMRNKGIVLSRGNIMEYVWNSESDPFSNTIESHISSLRRKINIDGKKDILKNLPGRGYIILDP